MPNLHPHHGQPSITQGLPCQSHNPETQSDLPALIPASTQDTDLPQATPPDIPTQQSTGAATMPPNNNTAATNQQPSTGPRYPQTISELHDCVTFFRSTMHTIPPERPHASCPGVYGRGCGGALEYTCYPPEMQISPYWACSKNFADARYRCAFRYYPNARLDYPFLDVMLVAPRIIEVLPRLGAEQAVAACGGVARILYLVGVDLSRAIKPGEEALVTSPQKKSRTSRKRKSTGSSTPGSPNMTSPTALQSPGLDSPMVSPGKSRPQLPLLPPDEALLQAVSQPSTGAVRFHLAYYSKLKPILLKALEMVDRKNGSKRHLLGSRKGIPEKVLEAFKHPDRNRSSPEEVATRYASLPPHLEAALLPFQKEGVLFGLERGGKCLIADEMGVGKTVQALALAAAYRSDSWPVLVIVPASMRLQWAEEFEKWLPGLNPGSIHLIADKSDQLRPTDKTLPPVCIISFRMMEHLTCPACKKAKGSRHADPTQNLPCEYSHVCMARLPWKMIIVDESHTLRTSSQPSRIDSLQTEAIRAAVKDVPRVIFLSGTPSVNKPFDLFNQVSMLRRGLFPSDRFEFSKLYCNQKLVPRWNFNPNSNNRNATGGGINGHAFYGGSGGGVNGTAMRYDNSGLSRAAEIHLVLKREIMVRRLKSQVLDQLPPKRRQVVRLPKPPAKDWPLAPGASRPKADDSDVSSDGEVDGKKSRRNSGASTAAAGGDSRSPGGEVKKMSAAHRTGVAKCRLVTEWIVEQLGLEGRAEGGEGGEEADGDDEGGGAAAGEGSDGGGGGGSSGGSSSSASVGYAPDTKFIVFAHHRTVMDHLFEKLGQALKAPAGRSGQSGRQYEVLRIDGETPAKDRQAVVERFRSDPTVKVALLSVSATATGVDFSAASAVIFAG